MQDDIFYGIFAINRDRASILKTYILCGISAVERERGRQCLYPADIYCGIFCCVNKSLRYFVIERKRQSLYHKEICMIFCYRQRERQSLYYKEIFQIYLYPNLCYPQLSTVTRTGVHSDPRKTEYRTVKKIHGFFSKHFKSQTITLQIIFLPVKKIYTLRRIARTLGLQKTPTWSDSRFIRLRIQALLDGKGRNQRIYITRRTDSNP